MARQKTEYRRDLDHGGDALIVTDGLLATNYGKTAHGLVRGSERYTILCVVDAKHAGKDAGEIVDGRRRAIPIYATLEAALGALDTRPQFCLVGCANKGGFVTDSLRSVLREALEAGMTVVSGMHEFLGNDAELSAVAKRNGAAIIDVRRPKPNPRFWEGTVLDVKTPRIAVLGTDCCLGKRTTARFLLEACRRDGLEVEMISTGQTGWMQGSSHGVVLDSIPNDFVSGELEHAVVSCEQDRNPDLMILEGQSSLRNPSGPCGSELILSAGARGVILQHAPGREFFLGFEEKGCRIPPVEEEVQLIELLGARVLAVALHTGEDTAEAVRQEQDRLRQVLYRPVVRPLEEGVDELLPIVQEFMAEEMRA